MKVLWVCNIMLPFIAVKLGMPYSNREGWLSGLAEKIFQKKDDMDLELAICFPTDAQTGHMTTEIMVSEKREVTCYGFVEDLDHPEKYDAEMEQRFQEIFAEYKPDIVHIFGTEFPHTLAAAKAFGKPEQLLIGIQGVVSEIAKAYTANIPTTVKYRMTIRDLLKQDAIWQQQEKFKKRGILEIEALGLTKNVTGRTDFDKKAALGINPGAEYYFMNETMRNVFYRGSWHRDQCDPYRIFLSAGDYPLKGFHYVLQAMPKILERYPEAKIYVAGANLISTDSWKDYLKRSSYGRYLRSLIIRYHLTDKVIMLGRITAEQMKEQYLKAHVFVCPSSLENSPNSLGEAMLLGVPCVAADVGGIHNMLVDGQDGILFPAADINKLGDAICEIFAREEVTKLYSNSAKKHAYITHDSDRNYRTLMGIYQDIYEKNNNHIRF